MKNNAPAQDLVFIKENLDQLIGNMLNFLDPEKIDNGTYLADKLPQADLWGK